VSDIDWSEFRKCPECLAALGQPCKSLDGVVVRGQVTEVQLNIRDRPHSTRKRRTAARAAQSGPVIGGGR